MARTIKLDTVTHPSNSGTANQTLDSSGQTSFPTVDINGGSIDNTTIGGSTSAAGTFTTLTSPTVQPTSGQSLLIKNSGGSVNAITVDTSGHVTVANNFIANGDTTIGSASSDTLTITATASGSANFSGLTGEIRMYGGTSEPAGWKFCDYQTLNTYTFRALHAVISNTYGGTAYNAGVTDQSGATTTFNVPDMRGRVPIGVNASSSLTDRGAKAIGSSGGADTHQLSTNELAQHNHTGPSHTHTFSATSQGQSQTHTHNTNAEHSVQTLHSSSDGNADILWPPGTGFNTGNASNDHTHDISGTTAASGTGNTGNTGSGAAHNNLQPYLTVNYIIKT
tara:strand:- start:4618 stop:5628 length:1011 start_codon:yes stop_codon:yes gene_type:complete